MAVRFEYVVSRMNGTMRESFYSKERAEEYARSIKRTPEEKIKIERTGSWHESYTYFV